MSDTVTVDPLEEGREAYARRAWPEAYRLLQEADREGRLEPGDLEALAKSAWWIGLATESIAAFERAYALHLERGNRSMAAMMALTLRREYGAKMAGSVAKAWLHRAEHLLEGEPEAVAHGYLEIAHRELDFDRGNLEGALAHLDRAQEIASRLDDADLPVWVAISRAEVLGTSGRLDEAFGLMEGAAAVAVGGELGPFTTGAVFCAVMSVCRETADYRRGTEWAEVSKRWCERQDISGFPGICRVHRAEFMRLTGAWADAASEAERASDELQRFHPAMAGEAFHELGEIRLRMGDLEGAEDAFGQAQALGSESQPGKALLLLARGRTDAAAASIKGSLEEITWNKLARARLLPAQAGIAKALGDLPTAETAAAELEVIAEEFGTAAIRAAAAYTAGLASLLSGDAAEAIQGFREARRLWREIDAPYEAAISTVLLAEARSAAGETEAATLELEAAQATFERLGATPDMARTDALLAGPATHPARGRCARSCSPTSWAPPRWWRRSGTRRGTTSSVGTTMRCAAASLRAPARRSIARATASSWRSRTPARRWSAPWRSNAPSRITVATTGSRRASVSGSTPPRPRERRGTTRAPACMRQRGSLRSHRAARCWQASRRSTGIGGVVTGEPREVSLKGLAKPVLVVAVDWRSPA